MSFFYRVHKDDIELVEQISAATQPHVDEYRSLGWGPDFNNELELRRLEERILFIQSTYPKPRIVGAFSPEPADPENYKVFYRGRQWEDPPGIDALKMQSIGIEKCKKAMK